MNPTNTTPRTDAKHDQINNNGSTCLVEDLLEALDFARTLEHELNEVRKSEMLARLQIDSGRARCEELRVLAHDMLSTFRHDDKTVLVTAERQEAWMVILKRDEVP